MSNTNEKRLRAESGGYLAVRKDDKGNDVVYACKSGLNDLKPGHRWATAADLAPAKKGA